jgi:uncharacterized repeat protein (TIGR03803 family)
MLLVRMRFITTVLGIAAMFAVAGSPSARAQTFTLLYSFQSSHDGLFPQGELILDKSGSIYGTTAQGGRGKQGTVFELDTSGAKTVLYSFGGTTGDGAIPSGQLAWYAGNIYGTTEAGGATGSGTVFELIRGKVTAKENFLYSFAEPGGNLPAAGLAEDGIGDFFGTTVYGSSGTPPPGCGSQGCGTVFEVSQGQVTLLHSFSGMPDGSGPQGSLVRDRSGNLYGTTRVGGAFNAGTVFELTPNSDHTWTEHVLYSFRGKSDGLQPYSGLVMDAKGNLYGATWWGGLNTTGQPGYGVVFELRQNPDLTWSERVLHRFAGPPEDGLQPLGNLVRDRHGNIYGVTSNGGASGLGIVYEVDVNGKETVLHNFTGNDGATPAAGLAIDTSGNLYGTTEEGGTVCNTCGTVFKITP